MTTIGAELARIARGEVWITMVPAPAMTQQHGYVHAGVVTSLLDTACGYAALTLMPPGSEVLTVEFKASFLAPARGDSVRAEATVIRAGRTLSVCRADAFAVQGDQRVIVATLLGTMMRISPDRAVPGARGGRA
jgi:uncharacterized protein (TIGR00369 family)